MHSKESCLQCFSASVNPKLCIKMIFTEQHLRQTGGQLREWKNTHKHSIIMTASSVGVPCRKCTMCELLVNKHQNSYMRQTHHAPVVSLPSTQILRYYSECQCFYCNRSMHGPFEGLNDMHSSQSCLRRACYCVCHLSSALCLQISKTSADSSIKI